VRQQNTDTSSGLRPQFLPAGGDKVRQLLVGRRRQAGEKIAQKIKRMKQRWINRLQGLPRLRRLALLDALSSELVPPKPVLPCMADPDPGVLDPAARPPGENGRPSE
jgi:hypothetical protein